MSENFQIVPLCASPFQTLFEMSDAELSKAKAVRMKADTNPGFPCRVSLQDAEIGETVVLLHYQHLLAGSPFDASHAIYVRNGAQECNLLPGEVPIQILSRLISVRAFDVDAMMIDADVVEGSQVKQAVSRLFENTQVDFCHLHYAKPGCFAAKAIRASNFLNQHDLLPDLA